MLQYSYTKTLSGKNRGKWSYRTEEGIEIDKMDDKDAERIFSQSFGCSMPLGLTKWEKNMAEEDIMPFFSFTVNGVIFDPIPDSEVEESLEFLNEFIRRYESVPSKLEGIDFKIVKY